MKINKKIGILIAIAITIVLLFVFPWFGVETVGALLYLVLLITVGAIIIDGISKFANRLVDALAKRQAVGNEEINTKIELIMQKMQTIENKVDKINIILEKVSD